MPGRVQGQAMWVCGVHLSKVMKTNSSERCRDTTERRKREEVFAARFGGEINIRLIYNGKRREGVRGRGGGAERETDRQSNETDGLTNRQTVRQIQRETAQPWKNDSFSHWDESPVIGTAASCARYERLNLQAMGAVVSDKKYFPLTMSFTCQEGRRARLCGCVEFICLQ